MLWYADNSELNGVRDTQIPDMLLFGGLAISPESEAKLRDAVEGVKAKYAHPRVPVKWNFKDLKPSYTSWKGEEMYEKMMAASKEWRREIFQVLAEFDCTVMLSCVQSHSVQTKVIKGLKQDLVRYSFSNGLMRVALHAQATKPSRYQVVLDWPEGGNSSPFDAEYATAFNEGRTSDHAVLYHSGPLRDLLFADSLVYANMRYTTMLQIADLIVGATREFLECAIGKKETGFGLDMCKLLAPRFRGFQEKRIFGRGISVSSGNEDFRTQIRDFIVKELQG